MILMKRVPEERFEGIGVCPGVAIGGAFLVDDPRGRVVRVFLPKEKLEAEIFRFRDAARAAQAQVKKTSNAFAWRSVPITPTFWKRIC